ncbi:MAG TPA: LamG domain-containing protein [Mycobacteriales bacterium]|nr:LamG domain-containing protein [Mycobacteriales bacterium]
MTTLVDAPHVNVLAGTGITLRIRVADTTGDNLRVSFDFRQKGAHHPLATAVSPPVRSGEVSSVTVLTDTALTDNITYQWRVRIRDLDVDGQPTNAPAVSPTCLLTQDGTPPASPVVASTDYPSSQFAGGVGKAGVFTFSPADPTDTSLADYRYGLEQPSPANSIPIGSDLTASVTLTPTTFGPLDLFVRAEDTAGNLSPVVDYHFFVNDADAPVAHWKLDEGSGSTVTGTVDSDPTAAGPTATLSAAGVSWISAGEVGAALHFDGTSGSVDAADARVTTDRNFTVAAWVRLDGRTAAGAAVSQDGTSRSGFSLRYDAVSDRWEFAVPSADSDDATVDAASSTEPVALGVWTHLAGSYDVATGQISLYVDGALAGVAAHPVGWDASGLLAIGRAQESGVDTDLWNGDVDEVRVYDRALTGTELGAIVEADKASRPVGEWAFDETSGTTAADSSGQDHALTLATGATFTADGHTGGGLTLDGLTGLASSTGPVIRTDESFTVAAWVKLSRADAPATIISQDGTNTSGFTLQYSPDNGGEWVFAVPPADTATSAPLAPATSFAFDPVGSWVYVAGAYDATSNQLELVVRDSFGFGVSFGTRQTPWNATGPLRIGADKSLDASGDTVLRDYLPGVVDDVRVYQAALTEAQLAQLGAG